jgi:Zn-dependent metalloprotease
VYWVDAVLGVRRRIEGDDMRLLCTILPPHLTDAVARNGGPAEREAILDTLAVDRSLVAMRMHSRLIPSALATAHTGLARTICDAKNSESLPGGEVRGEGDIAIDDITVTEAYDGLGATYSLFSAAYGRDSVDDEGLPLLATVHYGSRYDNAFWNGSQMVFGDGDGELFNRFTVALDVIGHELTHGVTQDEAGLIYQNQPGALNESLSDVFGSLVKQHALGQTAEAADWLIGAGLFTDRVRGVALRSMKAPGTAYDDPVLGKDPQPARMSDYVQTSRDNGGVHLNSGIPNRAFYLAAATLGGYAWERAGRIWYESMRSAKVRPTTGFARFAGVTVDVAGQLFGVGSAEQQAIRGAWNEVEVLP